MMNRTRKYFLSALITSLAISCSVAKELQHDEPVGCPTAAPPNILFILSDDQAPGDIHALGNPDVRTPHLDRLVETGTSFTRCFNQGSWSSAICVASRSMLITGQTVYRVAQNKTYLESWSQAKGPLAVKKETAVKLWPTVFREAGYRTFITGKWHNSQLALLQGFAEGKAVGEGFYNTYEQRDQQIENNPGYLRPAPGNDRWTPWDPRFHGHWTPEVKDILPDGTLGQPYTVQKHTSELYADAAVEFLDRVKHDDEPFFMFVSFNAPHDPRQAPKEFIDQYPPDKITLPVNFLPEHPFDNGALRIRDEMLAPFPRTEEAVRIHRAEYYAITTHMDHEIGRIFEALEKSGKADNTVIIFTSDHGLAVGSHGLMGKQNPYDHSIRMPFVIHGPGIPENRRVDDLIYMQGVFATTCELAGLEVPGTVEFKAFTELATGKSEQGGEPFIYGSYLNHQRLVRTDTHKLIHYPRIGRYQLFDLVKDPDETNDCVDDPAYAAIKEKLIAQLFDQRRKLGDGSLRQND